MIRPDGMGMDRHRERQNMREAARDRPEPNFDVWVITEDGEFVESSFYVEDAAEEAVAELKNAPELPDSNRYEIRERV